MCGKCGVSEPEWSWGDSPDYLRLLAERYGVDFEEPWSLTGTGGFNGNFPRALKEILPLPWAKQ